MLHPREGKVSMEILAIDTGGTHIKVLASGQTQSRMVVSGPTMTAAGMVEAVQKLTADWSYEVVSLGYPGPVAHDVLLKEPANLGPGWVGFDFAAALGRPTKIVNDAAMQALGSYEGGSMLFLGLGTGLGSALVVDGTLVPMELAHLPFKKDRTYEDYLGLRGLKRLGKAKWRRYVNEVLEKLRAALESDYVILGGGNAKLLKELPPNVRLGNNANAFVGGFRLWDKSHPSHPNAPVDATAEMKPVEQPG
jgi:polyphosphate glucokinase